MKAQLLGHEGLGIAIDGAAAGDRQVMRLVRRDEDALLALERVRVVGNGVTSVVGLVWAGEDTRAVFEPEFHPATQRERSAQERCTGRHQRGASAKCSAGIDRPLDSWRIVGDPIATSSVLTNVENGHAIILHRRTWAAIHGLSP